jgi:CRISPR-associated protein Csm1
MLRGRSLALQLIADAIAHRVLDRLELPVTNLLYSGGGKLWLLMAPTFESELHELAETIDLELSEAHGGRLSFAVGCAIAPLKDFATDAPAIWKKATADLGRSRYTRFAGILAGTDGYNLIFGVPENTHRACRVCGSLSANLQRLSPDEDDEQRESCNHCHAFVKLGNSATKTKVVLRLPQRAPAPAGAHASFAPFEEGCSYHLYSDSQDAREAPSDTTLLWLHQTPEFWDGRAGHTIWPAGLNRALGPRGEPLDFDELANNSNGIRRLGILRMDVDNLGSIFQRGLGERATVAHLAALSRHLTYFFGGYLSTLLKDPEYLPRAQIIYSGGDDVLIVGAWSTMPLLAKEIHHKLGDFAGSNPAVSISGGIAITLAGLPVTVAAEQAGDAEDEAKHLRSRKNSITFLGEPLGWEEFTAVINLKDRLQPLFRKKEGRTLARATLRNLHLIASAARNAGEVIRNSRDGADAEHLTWAVRRGKWAWQAAYAIARGPQNAELKTIYTEMQSAIGPSVDRPVLALLKPATEWIDLLGREKRDER